MKVLILYIDISPFLYSIISFEFIKRTQITKELSTSFSRAPRSLVCLDDVLSVLSFSLKEAEVRVYTFTVAALPVVEQLPDWCSNYG